MILLLSSNYGRQFFWRDVYSRKTHEQLDQIYPIIMHKGKNLQPLQNMDDKVHFMDDKNQHQNRMLKLWRICDLQETNYILLSIFLAVINATHLRIRVDTFNDYI